METKNKKTEKIFLLFTCTILVTVLSFVIFHMRNNALYHNRDRLIILSYQTNIGGSDGEMWASSLKEQFSQVPDFEVSVYETKEAGNENMTITSENGWGQLVVRLGAGQGDILLVNNDAFYNVLLAEDLLIPLTGNFEKPVTDSQGRVLGVDITDMTVKGLINYGTSEYVGKGQPLPIISIDEKNFNYNDMSIPPRVIAVIFKGSTHVEDAQHVLSALFGKEKT